MSASSCVMFPALFHLYMKGGRTAEVCTCLYTERHPFVTVSQVFCQLPGRKLDISICKFQFPSLTVMEHLSVTVTFILFMSTYSSPAFAV